MEAAEWKSGQGLRGDYANMAADWTVPQVWDDYGEAEHETWRRLCARQSELVGRYAAPEYLATLAALDFGPRIPRFADISTFLRERSGWEIVGVPGFLPDDVFFGHLAARCFPVTVWIRTPEEFDYIVEPDVFHDFFGHVPLLFEPPYADHLEEYGKGGLKAARLDAVKMLARLYWYTIEFGLIKTDRGLRIYGAGILSSGGEVVHSIESPKPQRVMFNLERMLRTDYRIDRYQDTYFVIESFEKLIEDTAPDFTPIYDRLRALPAHAPDAKVSGDRVV